MSRTTETQIVVMRHGEKDADSNLTARGAIQVAAAARQLAEDGFKFEQLVFSGAERTRQSALVAAATLGLDLPLREHRGFDFQTTFKETLDDKATFLAEAEEVKRAGGSVEQALELSEFARLGRRKLLEKALRDLAMDMISKRQRQVLVFSHSPWAELAAVNPSQMPYGLGEADAVCYMRDSSGRLVISELIRAPLPGAANV